MAVALLTSLVLALTFTPVLAEKFVRVKQKGDSEEFGKDLGFIIRPYEWLLRFALRNRLIVLAACVSVLILSYVIYKNPGSEFLPAFDAGGFVLDYIVTGGSSLVETVRMVSHVEEVLKG